jgi:hypothetical protein
MIVGWSPSKIVSIKMWNVDGRTKSDGNSSHGLKAMWAKNGIYVKLLLAM